MTDDLALIARAKSGCHAAQTELLGLNHGTLRKLALRRSENCPGADPEDFFQIACVMFLKALASYDGSVRLNTWIYKNVSLFLLTAREDCMMIRVPKTIHRDDPLRQPVSCVLSLSLFTPDGHELSTTIRDYRTDPPHPETEQVKRLRDAVAQLPERERLTMEGRMQGQTLEVIGESLGVGKQRVQQLYRRGVERLRKILA